MGNATVGGEHSIGLLVAERRHWTLLDLDQGEPIALTHSELSRLWERPEVRRVPPGSGLDPVEASAPLQRSEVDLSRDYVLNEPVVIRLDDRRFLAWSAAESRYVELAAEHLGVLEEARRPASGADLIEVAGHHSAALAELLAAAVIREAYQADFKVEVSDHSAQLGASAVEAGSLAAPSSDDGPAEDAANVSSDHVSSSGVVAALRYAARRILGRVDQPPRVDVGETTHGSPVGQTGDGRLAIIPLYCWPQFAGDPEYSKLVEPSLSTGMICAAARAYDDGKLVDIYDIHKIQKRAFDVVAEWERNPYPAIFTFSDYLWNIEPHRELSERIKQAGVPTLCLHGGPSVPKYQSDLEKFFAENPSVDLVVHGEGEITFCEILENLGGQINAAALERLSETPGLTFRRATPDGYELVRTPARARMADLDVLPSPYLTGEFDDLIDGQWRSASLETNRGCPYGCTFCDWGSATNSRIRKFDMDRIKAEVRWIIEKGLADEIYIVDANYGIFARDVEIVEHLASLRGEFGRPSAVSLNLAKNTTKHSSRIIEILVEAGIHPYGASAAVQSIDPATLKAVERENIKLEKYEELSRTFDEQGLPLMTDILVGLPGSTVESFKSDLQHCFDQEVMPRAMEIIMLPNSPMNAPEYKEKWELVVNEHGVLVGSSTYTTDDYKRMTNLRLLFRASDHFGTMRLLLRYLQVTHGLRALDVLDRFDQTVSADGASYPLMSFLARLFDIYTCPPGSWDAFYEEVIRFLGHEYSLADDENLRAVIEVQKAIVPWRGRRYPDTVTVSHDLSAYFADRGRNSSAPASLRDLREYPAATYTISDPGEVSDGLIRRNDFPDRRSATQGNLFWVGYDWELDSPFRRHLCTNVGRFKRAAA